MQFKIIFQCFLCALCAHVSAQTDLIPFRKGNLWGFCKRDKTIVTPCEYDEVNFFENHTALIRKGLRYGLLDETGREIYPCQSYIPIVFHEGLAQVANDTCIVTGHLKVIDSLSARRGITQATERHFCKVGFINEKGEIVIPCIYTQADDFKSGHALVTASGGHYELLPAGDYTTQRLHYVGKRGYINKKGIPIGAFDTATDSQFSRFENGIAFLWKQGKQGLIDTQNRVIVSFKYNTLMQYDNKYYRTSLGYKWGLITLSGQEIVPPIYDEAYPVGNSIVVSKHNLYGLLDSLGKELLPCISKGRFQFNEGLSPSLQNQKYGFVNEQGKMVIPFRYDKASRFENGRAWVESEQNSFYIDKLGHYVGEPEQQYWVLYRNGTYRMEDKTGNLLLPADTQHISIIKEHFAIVVKNKLYGLFDIKKQRFVLPFAYSMMEWRQADDGKKGVFVTRQNHLSGLVNFEGKQIAACEYDEFSPIQMDSTTHLVQLCKNKKFGCLDLHTGNVVISFTYDKPFSWIKGQSVVHKNGKMGIIDLKERIIVPIEYKFPDDDGLFYNEGLAPIYKNEKMGFMDSTFQIKIPLEYDVPYETAYFQKGLAPVSKSDSFGFINRQNQVIVPLQYAAAHGMEEGRTCIHTDTHTQFLDSLGKPVTDWIQGTASPYRSQVSILKIAKDTQVLLNLQGKPISKKYHQIEFLNDSLLLVQSEQFGLMDLQGVEIIPTIYEKIELCNKLFYRASKTGKHGFISKRGQKFVISDDIPKPLNQCFILRTGQEACDENWSLIDSTGQTLIPMQGGWIHAIENYYRYSTLKKKVRITHIIDGYGTIKFEGEGRYDFEKQYAFDEPRAFIDKYGKIRFEGAYDFDDSPLYWVKKEEKKVGLLNLKTFEWVFPCVYDNLRYIGKGLYKIENKGITYYAKNNKTIYYEN